MGRDGPDGRDSPDAESSKGYLPVEVEEHGVDQGCGFKR